MKVYKDQSLSGTRTIALSGAPEVILKQDSADLSQAILPIRDEKYHEFSEKELSYKKSVDDLNGQLEKLKIDNGYLEQALQALQLQNLKNNESVFIEAKNTGYEEGIKNARDHVSTQMERFDGLLKALDKKIDDLLIKEKSCIAEAVYRIVCRILGEKYESEKLINTMIDTALSDIKSNVRISIFVNQFDHDFLKKNDEFMSIKIPGHIELYPDQRVEMGGCIIETDVGAWDARMETQLTSLKEHLIRFARSMDETHA